MGVGGFGPTMNLRHVSPDAASLPVIARIKSLSPGQNPPLYWIVKFHVIISSKGFLFFFASLLLLFSSLSRGGLGKGRGGDEEVGKEDRKDNGSKEGGR